MPNAVLAATCCHSCSCSNSLTPVKGHKQNTNTLLRAHRTHTFAQETAVPYANKKHADDPSRSTANCATLQQQ